MQATSRRSSGGNPVASEGRGWKIATVSFKPVQNGDGRGERRTRAHAMRFGAAHSTTRPDGRAYRRSELRDPSGPGRIGPFASRDRCVESFSTNEWARVVSLAPGPSSHGRALRLVLGPLCCTTGDLTGVLAGRGACRDRVSAWHAACAPSGGRWSREAGAGIV